MLIRSGSIVRLTTGDGLCSLLGVIAAAAARHRPRVVGGDVLDNRVLLTDYRPSGAPRRMDVLACNALGDAVCGFTAVPVTSGTWLA